MTEITHSRQGPYLYNSTLVVVVQRKRTIFAVFLIAEDVLILTMIDLNQVFKSQ